MVSMFPGVGITISVECSVFGERQTYLDFREKWHEIVALSAHKAFDSLASQSVIFRANIKVQDSNEHDFLVIAKYESSDFDGAFRAYFSWKEDLKVQLPFAFSFENELIQKETESWEIVAKRADQFNKQQDELRRLRESRDSA